MMEKEKLMNWLDEHKLAYQWNEKDRCFDITVSHLSMLYDCRYQVKPITNGYLFLMILPFSIGEYKRKVALELSRLFHEMNDYFTSGGFDCYGDNEEIGYQVHLNQDQLPCGIDQFFGLFKPMLDHAEHIVKVLYEEGSYKEIFEDILINELAEELILNYEKVSFSQYKKHHQC